MSILALKSSFGKRELVALLNLSSWCLVMVEQLFRAVPWGCLRFVIVVFPDHSHLLFFPYVSTYNPNNTEMFGILKGNSHNLTNDQTMRKALYTSKIIKASDNPKF